MTSPEQTPDRLVQVEEAKRRTITVAGKHLVIQKWSLRLGMRLSSKLLSLLQTALGGLGALMVAQQESDAQPEGEGDPAEALAARMMAQNFDISELMEEHYDSIVEILSASIVKNNFESESAALEWVEELALEEAIEVAAPIVEINVRPLMGSVGKMTSLLTGAVGSKKESESKEVRKDAEPQT